MTTHGEPSLHQARQKQHTGPWDVLIGELRALRARAGDPSFAALARLVEEHRVAAGVEGHAARVAKSSVHDAFRLGRTRINLAFVRDLVRALDGDPALVDVWVRRSRGLDEFASPAGSDGLPAPAPTSGT